VRQYGRLGRELGKGQGIGERHGWKIFRCDRDLVLNLNDLVEGEEVAEEAW